MPIALPPRSLKYCRTGSYVDSSTRKRTVTPGKPFEIILVFKALQTVSRPWKVFTHIDGPQKRKNADHEPAGGRCPTSTWHSGDVIVDRVTVTLDSFYDRGAYTIWIGFFTGWPPKFRNLLVSDAPDGLRGVPETHPHSIRVADLVVE